MGQGGWQVGGRDWVDLLSLRLFSPQRKHLTVETLGLMANQVMGKAVAEQAGALWYT